MSIIQQLRRGTRLEAEANTPAAGEPWWDTTLNALRIGTSALVGGWLMKQWGRAYVVAPAQITGNQNDYSPADLAIAETLQLTSDAARSITGLAGGSLNRRLTIINTGSFNITLSDASGSSTAANRFAIGEDVVLRSGGGIDLQYDATASRWRRASGGQKLASIPEDFLLTGVSSPAQITANQNDYAPVDAVTASKTFALCTIFRLSSDASRNITGIVDPRSGARKTIINVGSFAIVIKNADAGSTAANRFDIGADLTLAGKQAATFVYDATDSRWKLEAQTAGQAVADAGATAVKLGTSAFGMRTGIINGTLTVTHNSPGSNQLTVALKTLAGADPTASDPVRVVFQTGSGGYVVRDVTAALSLVLSAGSSLGFTNSIAGRVWWTLFDTGSGVVIGALNARSGTDVLTVHEGLTYSSTAEGGAGGADSAHVFYTASAQTTKYIALAGYSDWDSGLATAGNWASAPTRTVLWSAGMPRPGERLQIVRGTSATVASGSTQIPTDNSVPQSTEGDQYLTKAITPSAIANILIVRASLHLYVSTAVFAVTTALFVDSDVGASAAMPFSTQGSQSWAQPIGLAMLAGTLSARTFKVRAGPGSAATVTFNGHSAVTQLYGGASASYIEVEEIMG